MCEMGGMALADYAYFIGLLGIVVGLAIILGFHHGA